MGGIGQLLGGLLGQILPFAKGGVIKGKEHEYVVKIQPHKRRLPEDKNTAEGRTKYTTKTEKKTQKKTDAFKKRMDDFKAKHGAKIDADFLEYKKKNQKLNP